MQKEYLQMSNIKLALAGFLAITLSILPALAQEQENRDKCPDPRFMCVGPGPAPSDSCDGDSLRNRCPDPRFKCVGPGPAPNDPCPGDTSITPLSVDKVDPSEISSDVKDAEIIMMRGSFMLDGDLREGQLDESISQILSKHLEENRQSLNRDGIYIVSPNSIMPMQVDGKDVTVSDWAFLK